MGERPDHALRAPSQMVHLAGEILFLAPEQHQLALQHGEHPSHVAPSAVVERRNGSTASVPIGLATQPADRLAALAFALEDADDSLTMVAIVIGILILLPLAVWMQRLQARGVISDDRPLDRVIRERLTGKPARLTPSNYHQSRVRYYRLVFLQIPLATTALAVIIATTAKPHNTLGLILSPAFVAGLIVLAISEDRFTGISRRRRMASASVSGLFVAMLAFVLVAGVDPHAALTSAR
jgi:heme/copper-type cytochrome/quinol oxidase subunit 4